MDSKGYWWRGSVLLLALLGVAASGRADEPPYHARLDSDGVQRVQIVGGSYFFRPAHVIVKAGVPVELSVQMEQGMIPHSFVLEAPQAGLALRTELAVQPRVLRFVPAVTGRYPFYCAHKLLFFASHRQRGMEGIFEVVD
ncbi:quinol oxidase [Vogesella sp. GCM10023246]|uniref:Quinol oxidase n=1 Tax=Vogesella oryzagri TaxID=3160864 RepID=A0ABV1M3R2_9NEIS